MRGPREVGVLDAEVGEADPKWISRMDHLSLH